MKAGVTLRITHPSGTFHLPLALALAMVWIAGAGFWGFLRDWRKQVEIQLHLDQCLGSAAQELRDRMNRIEAINSQIRQLRLATAAATLLPEARPALQAALAINVKRQEFELLRWQQRRLGWIVRLGCGKGTSRFQPLPAMQWLRGPPDFLGPQPLRWTGPAGPFHLEVRRGSRKAAARVEKQARPAAAGGNSENIRWTAHWNAPRGLLGASIY